MAKSLESSEKDVESKLMEEFERVRRLLEITGLAGVVWKPNQPGNLSGEVKNGVVYIYECDGYKALETLRHEMMDYHITSRLIRPLIDVINSLIKLREAEIYKEKEKIVEQLSKLLSEKGNFENAGF